MAVSATIALSSATTVVGQSTIAALTVTNGNASTVNILNIAPYAYPSTGATNGGAAVQLGLQTVTLPVAIAAAGNAVFYFPVLAIAPSTGKDGLTVGTYKIGANVQCSDASCISPTVTSLTVNPQPNSNISLSNSLITASASSIAAAGGTATVTLTAFDGFNRRMTTGGKTVVFSLTGGTATISASATTDVGDGTYTCTVTGSGSAGTAKTCHATINGGAVISSPLPTISTT